MPEMERPRVFMWNFNGAVGVNFNKTAALELFDLLSANIGSLSEVMAGLIPKLEMQFNYMHREKPNDESRTATT